MGKFVICFSSSPPLPLGRNIIKYNHPRCSSRKLTIYTYSFVQRPHSFVYLQCLHKVQADCARDSCTGKGRSSPISKTLPCLPSRSATTTPTPMQDTVALHLAIYRSLFLPLSTNTLIFRHVLPSLLGSDPDLGLKGKQEERLFNAMLLSYPRISLASCSNHALGKPPTFELEPYDPRYTCHT